MNAIGISAFYHDSAAALLQNGIVTAAVQEERFTRIKNDPSFPKQSIKYCLDYANLTLDDIDHVIFYEKPFLKFERLLETYFAYAPRGFKSFSKAMPIWLKEKLFLKSTIRKELQSIACNNKLAVKLLFTEHHQSHAASAFFPSPFENAAILCIDGVGEWSTTSAWLGTGKAMQPLWQINFPHSLGLLYSAFTYHAGFKVNSGEYKLMGLAPYGEANYVEKIKDNLIDVKADGSFRLNMDYFNYATGLTMTNRKFNRLFNLKIREPESELTQQYMDMAKSVQTVVEDVVDKLARSLRQETQSENLCLAGGVALNCVNNGKIIKNNIFDNVWIQPAAGDAGGAIGAVYSYWHNHQNQPRHPKKQDSMSGSLLGPSYSLNQILDSLETVDCAYTVLKDEIACKTVAQLLSNGNVIGWFSGRMEFGPRALGSRSILADPRPPEMQSKINLKIKYRESFRPFAPIVKADKVNQWFDYCGTSPYMLMTTQVKDEKRVAQDPLEKNTVGLAKLKVARSKIPAVTHVDYSARVQTVDNTMHPRLYKLLDEFEKITDCPVLVNTSFNVRGEPIVNTPLEAYRCFMATEMDALIIENILFTKTRQESVT